MNYPNTTEEMRFELRKLSLGMHNDITSRNSTPSRILYNARMTALVQGIPLEGQDHLTIATWNLLQYAQEMEALVMEHVLARPPTPIVMNTNDWDFINGRATHAYQG